MIAESKDPVDRMMVHFESGHGAMARECERLARSASRVLPRGAELTAGLRKLMEARDCFARAWDERRPLPPRKALG